MKKLSIFFLATLLVCNNAYAIWYIIDSDGVVRTNCSSEPDSADLDTRGQYAVQSSEVVELGKTEYRGKKFVAIPKTAAEIAEEARKNSPEYNFDIVKFQGDLFVHVSEYSNVNLRLEFAAINTFAQNKDFSGMKQYLQFLVSNAIATEGDYGIISSVLMTQGIDLSKY
jgi:hypothetical protein